MIPGLAFDHSFNRLGRGGGYYDRALFQRATESVSSVNAIKIGVSFDRYVLLETLPCDSHDIAMDYVVTESRVLKRAAAYAERPV